MNREPPFPHREILDAQNQVVDVLSYTSSFPDGKCFDGMMVCVNLDLPIYQEITECDVPSGLVDWNVLSFQKPMMNNN